MRPHMDQRTFGVHRPITIEARLYLDSEYQTLVEKQAIIQGGPDDPDLAQAVASLTQNLLGPSGAYRAVATGQRTAYATITPTKWETEIQPHGVADDLRWGPIAGVAGASGCRHPTRLFTSTDRRKRGKRRPS